MQNNNFARASHFVYISLPFLHDYDLKMPKFAFYGASLKNQITIILFKIWPTNRFSKAKSYNFNFIKTMSHDLLVQMNVDMMPWNSASGRFAYILQRKWVGITAIKTQKTQIHFFSDFLVAIASLDLKVPTGVFLHVPSNSSRSLCESSLGPVSLWFLKWQIAAISAKAFCFSRNVSGGCSRSWTGVFTSSVSAYHSTKSRSERCTRQTAQN